jgi:hypothetical protein
LRSSDEDFSTRRNSAPARILEGGMQASSPRSMGRETGASTQAFRRTRSSEISLPRWCFSFSLSEPPDSIGVYQIRVYPHALADLQAAHGQYGVRGLLVLASLRRGLRLHDEGRVYRKGGAGKLAFSVRLAAAHFTMSRRLMRVLELAPCDRPCDRSSL